MPSQYTSQDIQNFFAQNPNMPAAEVAQLAYKHGVSPEQISDATGFGLGYVTDQYNRGNNFAQSGLRPAFDTLAQGGAAATQRIDQTQQQVGDIYKQGLSYLDPYMQQGQGANQLQAALSGAMGPEAQQQAFTQYRQSPGVSFAQGEAERALLRNKSALGGLGGGNVMRDLTQLAAGTFMQDYNNQFNQLGSVADRGLSSATTGAGLQGQQGQVQAGLGQYAASIPMQIAQAQSGQQFQAGRDQASAIQGTTSALSQLINQQGAGMTDILGGQTSNINSLYQNALGGDANAREQLAAMLGNLSTSNASMVGNQPIIQGQQTNYLGQLGQVAQGVGGLYAGINSGNSATNSTTPNTTYMTPQTSVNLGLYPGGPARFGGQ